MEIMETFFIAYLDNFDDFEVRKIKRTNEQTLIMEVAGWFYLGELWIRSCNQHVTKKRFYFKRYTYFQQ